MRKILAILVCKVLRKVGKLINRGSSLPGRFALLIDPDILSKIKMPKNIVAVTGSNGKTSTVEMIYAVLNDAGMKVAYNFEGSNQIEGITTLVLSNSSLIGKFIPDVLLLETDERYAKNVFEYITPTYYVINNLYRDQMTRNGHPEYVLEDIKKSIKDNTILVLNSDDPLVSSLGHLYRNPCYYFGNDDFRNAKTECDSVYNDGYYCPVCKNKMVYEKYHYAHIGKYLCNHCGFSRKEPFFKITRLDLTNGIISINSISNIKLAYKSIYNAYNILAAYSLCSLLEVEYTSIVNTLNNYLIKNGRLKNFETGSKKGTLLISKHENSISYNQNIRYIVENKEDVSVLIIVDSISRKYFTSDTSWLWDINFEQLKAKNVKKIIISGRYANDLATRLIYAGLCNKLVVKKNIDTAAFYLRFKGEGKIYTLTCFSDENKFLKEVKRV